LSPLDCLYGYSIPTKTSDIRIVWGDIRPDIIGIPSQRIPMHMLCLNIEFQISDFYFELLAWNIIIYIPGIQNTIMRLCIISVQYYKHV